MYHRPSKDSSKAKAGFKTAAILLRINNCMYVCTVITSMVSKSKDQPGKVASPARCQLNSEDEYFPVPVRAREFGFARRVQ